MTQEQQRLFKRAQTNVFNRRAQYNRAWRADPTRKGYPRVDKALDKLEAAEKELRDITDEISRAEKFKL